MFRTFLPLWIYNCKSFQLKLVKRQIKFSLKATSTTQVCIYIGRPLYTFQASPPIRAWKSLWAVFRLAERTEYRRTKGPAFWKVNAKRPPSPPPAPARTVTDARHVWQARSEIFDPVPTVSQRWAVGTSATLASSQAEKSIVELSI